jgi:hypothetical protein
MSDKSLMHDGGESYSGVVPAKQPNKDGRPSAEVVEERPLAKENTEQSNQCRTQSRESGTNGLERPGCGSVGCAGSSEEGWEGAVHGPAPSCDGRSATG